MNCSTFVPESEQIDKGTIKNEPRGENIHELNHGSPSNAFPSVAYNTRARTKALAVAAAVTGDALGPVAEGARLGSPEPKAVTAADTEKDMPKNSTKGDCKWC